MHHTLGSEHGRSLVFISAFSLILALNVNSRRVPGIRSETSFTDGSTTPVLITALEYGWPLAHRKSQTTAPIAGVTDVQVFDQERTFIHGFDGKLVANVGCWLLLLVGAVATEYAYTAKALKFNVFAAQPAEPVRSKPNGNRLGLTNSFRNGVKRRRGLFAAHVGVTLGLSASAK
jgi:hypothetical protein